MLANIAIGIVFLVLGALAGVGLPEFLKRPKVRVNGSGSGPLGPWRIITVSVTSVPGFFGLKVGNTTILGLPLFGGRPIGITTERRPARCTASLQHLDGGGGMGMYFVHQTHPEQATTTPEVTIGEEIYANVATFVRADGEDRFFVFQGLDENGEPKRPLQEGGYYSGTTHFTLLINSGRRRPTRAKVGVRRHVDGHLAAEVYHGRRLSSSSSTYF